MKQYTIRKIPDYLDHIARKKSIESRKSLNSVLLDALTKGFNADEQLEYHDMDDLAGTWAADPEISDALSAFEKIDEDLWT